jgi:CheY-like chemotaxis protein
MMRILVVDDVVDAAEGLSTLFDAMGHETQVAFDGWGALDLVRSFQPRVVFLDPDMPLLDGYEAALAIRRDATIAQPHLVALTGSQGLAVNAAVKAAGFDSYMHKPADTMALIAVVTEIASRA